MGSMYVPLSSCGAGAHCFPVDHKVYNIPDALDPEAPMDAAVFLNGTLQATYYLPRHTD
jgi:hypothetical protein